MCHEAGRKCTDNYPIGNDEKSNEQKRQTAADFYNLLVEFDGARPKEMELAISKIPCTETGPGFLESMPSLIYSLAGSYHGKQNYCQELRYVHLVSCVYDPSPIRKFNAPDPHGNFVPTGVSSSKHCIRQKERRLNPFRAAGDRLGLQVQHVEGSRHCTNEPWEAGYSLTRRPGKIARRSTTRFD